MACPGGCHQALWHRSKATDPFVKVTRAIVENVADAAEADLYHSAAKLLGILFDRDQRRSFTEDGHWLVKEISKRDFKAELAKEDAQPAAKNFRRAHCVLQRLPHILPHKFRIELLRDSVARDKARAASEAGPYAQAPYITVRRTHLLTDGFREMTRLPASALKQTIRIKFVNEQGLDEIGIDENGVFKEFLEETIKEAFNPDFGLFSTTSDNRLYPSSLAPVLQPDWAPLFEFVGRMLGKSVFEGHLVELPFAHFFLNLLLGRQNTLDELPSLDPELSKNLRIVKTYEGDVSDLALCFAVDEEVCGKMVSLPLLPGGEGIDVTNENRILYCHSMADYRLNRRLHKQCNAFITGFRSVIDYHWLRCFSAPELQRLIAGDDARIDMDDIKRHSTYIGGYTGSHRVIKWLWQAVAEFTVEEQAMFLKFVTSCSKPPVLGFATLQPALSVRAVTDDSDPHGYSLGSAIGNFFRPGINTDRLPTSSTCFNLLKLPIYKSKKILKEKLKYAITSGAGFELA